MNSNNVHGSDLPAYSVLHIEPSLLDTKMPIKLNNPAKSNETRQYEISFKVVFLLAVLFAFQVWLLRSDYVSSLVSSTAHGLSISNFTDVDRASSMRGWYLASQHMNYASTISLLIAGVSGIYLGKPKSIFLELFLHEFI
jgi:hypothetical protein